MRVAAAVHTFTLLSWLAAGEFVLDREEITQNQSMMPEGPWNGLAVEQVRDLVGYLASPVQVPLESP